MLPIVSLYDFTGEAVHPWAEAGYDCYCFDIQHPVDDKCSWPDNLMTMKQVGNGRIFFIHWNAHASNWLATITAFVKLAYMVMGFPPCDDLAGCGAKHWEGKAKIDPNFQIKAMLRVKRVPLVAKELQTDRWVLENPSGAISRLWRRFDHSFHPCFYGGYVPKGKWKHPIWPQYIAARDAYRKLTCLWAGTDYKHPEYKEVKPEILTGKSEKKGTLSFNRQTKKLGGRSLKTKNIRSATLRGWARAVFLFNKEQ